MSKAIRALLGRTNSGQNLWIIGALGALVSLFAPLLAYLLGSVLNVLIESARTGTQDGRLSSWLPDAGSVLPETWPPLGRISALLLIALFAILTSSLVLLLFYRETQRAAVEFELTLIGKLREHAKRMASVRTLSAQQTALTDGLDYHLPRVRASLSRWWKTYPRHLIQLLNCLLVAFLIWPTMLLLTLIAGLLLLLIYRFQDRNRRVSLPVIRERASQERASLTALCIQGPLLESVHDKQEVDKRFSQQMLHYRRDAVKSLSSSAWKTPSLIAFSGILATLYLFVISVQLLREQPGPTIAGIFVFTVCCVGAAISAVRLQRSARELKHVENAADDLDRFLSQRVEELKGENLKSLSRVSQQAELDHVTLQDSSGRKLLENVSLILKPGSLVGVVADQSLQAHALAELLMGFGRPISGRLLIDGHSLTDLQPSSLSNCSIWVAPDGPIVTGTLRDNFERNGKRRPDSDIQEALVKVKMSDALHHLPDDLSTLITPKDDRLSGDSPFRIGLARASLRDASIVVIEEPESRFDAKTEQDTLDAIRSLVNPSRITLLIPQRLVTLRHCDTVIMLHDHRVADIGTHAELLQRNEFYRHLNYLRFNAFRAIGK